MQSISIGYYAASISTPDLENMMFKNSRLFSAELPITPPLCAVRNPRGPPSYKVAQMNSGPIRLLNGPHLSKDRPFNLL